MATRGSTNEALIATIAELNATIAEFRETVTALRGELVELRRAAATREAELEALKRKYQP